MSAAKAYRAAGPHITQNIAKHLIHPRIKNLAKQYSSFKLFMCNFKNDFE